MGNRVRGIVAFAAGLAILVVALKALNWFPLLAQKDLLRRYGDFEEMRAAIGIRDVLVPSYFPEDFRWPPTSILAQGRPYRAVIMEFAKGGTGKSREIGLLISQSASDDFFPGGALELVRVREKAPFSLKGREAVLEVGTDARDEPCTRISWREKDFRVIIMARSTPFQLIRVAESMLR